MSKLQRHPFAVASLRLTQERRAVQVTVIPILLVLVNEYDEEATRDDLGVGVAGLRTPKSGVWPGGRRGRRNAYEG